MRKLFVSLLAILLLSGSTACSTATSTPAPSISPLPSATPTTIGATATPTVPPSPTPTPTPTPTIPPPPPLSQPLYPETWLQNPNYGAAAPEQGLVLRLRRGYTFTADLSPAGDELALARLYGVYLCPLPQDPQGGTPLSCRAYLDHQGLPVVQVRYSPTGRTLATLDPRGNVRLWDLQHPDAPPQVLPLFPERADKEIWSPIGGLAFSPDGRYLAAADGFRLALWDLEAGQAIPLGAPVNLPDPVDSPKWHSVAFASDGRLAAGTWGGQWLILDPSQPQESLQLFPASRDEAILDLTFTPQEDVLLLYRDDFLRRVSPQTGQLLAESKAPFNYPLLSRFRIVGGQSNLSGMIPRGFGPHPFLDDRLVLPTGEGSLLFLSLQNLQLDHALQRPQAPLYFAESVFASWTPDGQRLVGVWGDGTVVVWQASDEQVVGYTKGKSEVGQGVSFDPLGRQMSAGVYGSTLSGLIWSLPDNQIRDGAGGHRAYSSDGCFQASYHYNRSEVLDIYLACRWPPTQDPTLKLEGTPFDTFPLPPLFLDPYPWVALVTDEGQPVQIFSLQDGTHLKTLQDGRLGGAYALAADPGAGRLYQGGPKSQIGVWDFQSGRLEALWLIPNPPSSTATSKVVALALSRDGRILVAARNDGLVAVLDTATGTVRQTFQLEKRGPIEFVLVQMSLTADGRWLVGLPTNLSQLVVIDLEQGKQVAAATPPLAGDGATETLAISPDERFVAVHGTEGSVAVWSLPDLVARSGAMDLLPLPVLAEGAEPLPSFRTRYTVTLTIGEQVIPLLDVVQEGQRDAEPPRRHLTFEGQGWPVTGEAFWRADGWLGFGPLAARTPADEKWYATNYVPVPPTAPLLRPWGWTYQGFHEGLHYYRSTSWTSAPLPPPAWISRALEDDRAVFHPQSFLGEVALAPDRLLLSADLTWEGEISTSQDRQKARIEAHYRLESTAPVTISLPPDEEIIGPIGLTLASAEMVGPFPLYPGLLEDPEDPNAYLVHQPAAEILAWYQEQLPLYGFTNLKLEEESILGMVSIYQLSAEKEGHVYTLIITSSLGITVVHFPPTEGP